MVLPPRIYVKGRIFKKTKKRWIVTNSCGIVCGAERRKRQGKTVRKEAKMQITEITQRIQQKTEKIRLAAYYKELSDSADQLHSFATQIQYYSDYEKKNPQYQLVDVYSNDGIARTTFERPGVKKLLEDAQQGIIKRYEPFRKELHHGRAISRFRVSVIRNTFCGVIGQY